MRHLAKTHSFGRRSGPKKALLRGLVYSLVEHGRIKTTVTKAKELRRHVERAVTMGKKGTVHARRVLMSRFPNESVVASLVDDLAPRFKSREGGYTRIIRLGQRAGDNAEMAYIEFVDYKLPEKATEETVKGKTKEEKAASRVLTKEKANWKKNVRRMKNQSRAANR